LLVHPCFSEEAHLTVGCPGLNGRLKVLQSALCLSTDSSGTPQRVMHPGNQNLADEFLAAAPVLRPTGELPRGLAVSLL